MKRIRLEVEPRDGSANLVVRFYLIESDDLRLEGFLRQRGHGVFADELLERWHMDNWPPPADCAWVVERSFLPGVTDNAASSAAEGLRLAGMDCRVASGEAFYLSKRPTLTDWGNPLIHRLEAFPAPLYAKGERFARAELPRVSLPPPGPVRECPLDGEDKELAALSSGRCLALSVAELGHLRDHFKGQTHRQKRGLPAGPTDVELEIVAQTWSEHCKHKIFSAHIAFEGQIIEGLYPTYIKGTTAAIERERQLDWLVSVFSDNAGIVRFDPKVDFCVKVETHNSPSALDPYGGALTGILGVNRDILGAGLGGRPIANTDVFCVGPPDWPDTPEREGLMPAGLLNPGRLLSGVHQGVKDGGNKSGVPTVSGAMAFDPDYCGKPLIFCGTVGVLPREVAGRPGHAKTIHPGDCIVMAGGAIGADGIHGATFSSLELSDSSPATAVQIGDPLTQKRLADFLLEARDLGLYHAVTDNGAGGLSSSVGEMALQSGGARLDLARCPVKYPGLAPWELMISESQERMSLAVSPQHWEPLRRLARRRGVEVANLGEFNASGRLEVFYRQELVADLDLHFLHHGLVPMKLQARWTGPRQDRPWWGRAARLREDNFWGCSALADLLSRPNIASKEFWLAQYDQQVQAATRLGPLVTNELSSPQDGALIWAWPHGGERSNALALGQGLAPRLSAIDPFLMAQWAVDEAVRNVLAAGADIKRLCLLDNFCWPDPVASPDNPAGEFKLGQLVRACQGLAAICSSYGTPLVSGKDSMKNDFRGRDRRGKPLNISIPPTLLITALAQTDMNRACSTEFKEAGDIIYLLGHPATGLLASEYAEIFDIRPLGLNRLPAIDLEKNIELYSLLSGTDIRLRSCHDISEGGALVAIAEACFSRRLGANIEHPGKADFFFNEAPGRFIVSLARIDQRRFEDTFKDRATYLGQVQERPCLSLPGWSADIDQLYDHWNSWNRREWKR